MVKLFHGTSEFAYQKIYESGFIGVNEDDYVEYVIEIFNLLDVPSEKYKRFIDRMRQEIEEYAPNGSVSFFPKWREHKIYFQIIGSQLGESFGHTLRQAIKYASRVTKTSYKDNLKKMRILGKQRVVVLEVDLPDSFIANKDSIGSLSEIYTIGKVPIEYIRDVIFL